MLLPFNPMNPWRRLQLTRRLRRGSGEVLPAWALGELSLSAAQAAWLQRTLFGWYALPLREGLSPRGAPLALPALIERLSAQGLALRACRLAEPAALCRGDVVWLADDAAARLFGEDAALGGGLALVVEAGTELLRLSPALAAQALSCRGAELRGQLAGWVLRSHLQGGNGVAAATTDRAWAEGLAVAA